MTIAKLTFAANLQNVGLVPNETRVLLTAFAESGDWKAVRRQALEENLIGKRSTITTRHILKVIARRYIRSGDGLPSAHLSARFFARTGIPDRARIQVAFLYTVAEDALAATLLQSIVIPKLPSDATTLHPNDVLQHLRTLEAEHPELARWRPYLRRRWASAFLSLLRDGGFMSAGASWALARPSILPQAFGFVFGWLALSNGSPKAALQHPAIQLWAVDATELRALLAEGQDRGWWRFAFRGELFDFHPGWRSNEELIDVLG